MADQKLSELTLATTVGQSDLLYVVQAGASKRVAVSSVASSVASTIVLASPPATSTSTGTKGTLAYDSSNVYVCIATNTWKRASLIADW